MFAGKDKEDAERAEKMMKNMVKDVTVEKTDETQTINGRKCTKYNVTMMGISTEQWVTKDVKTFMELKEDTKKYMEKFKDNSMISQMMNMDTSAGKVDGFPHEKCNPNGQVQFHPAS